MLDVLIRGGTVVDGTGGPPRREDIGIREGRLVMGGESHGGRAETLIDADGLMVAPGFVDLHTHYDAQLFWDATASPSNIHGVTTIIGGNCGFTLAPIKPADHDYIRRMMAKVEGMPLDALENGVPWDWTTFGEYLDRLDGHLGVNAGFLVGHCALRRWVMGAERASEVADDDEIAAMTALLADALASGGLGFSSSQSRTHSDGDGKPISSRHADRREMLAFCQVVADHPGTTLEYITNGCLDTFSDEEIDLMVAMTTTAHRPLNWNVLTVDSRTPEKTARQLQASARAAEVGGRIIALTMPTLVPMNMSFRTHCALFLIPGWGDVMGLPPDERMAKLRDPAVRAHLDEVAHSKDAGVFRRLSHWANYIVGDTFSPDNEGLSWRDVGSIAQEQSKEPFDTLLDIVLADDLRTVLWPKASDGDDASWQARVDVWADPGAMIGGSDAGAHLDRMCGSNYPTSFLGDCLRKRRLVPVERAIEMMTDAPARLFGLVRTPGGHPCRDWKAFEPLVGHTPSALVRAPFGRVRRLKPAQIANLIEDASRQEGEEILDVVHADPELEADVFEELNPDLAARLFGDKSDGEVAEVLAHMRADDAADALTDLPQNRRQAVLDALPLAARARILTLLGFNATSAGGIMGIEFLTGPPDETVEVAVQRIRDAERVQPEALLTMHVVDEVRRLMGTVTVIGLLQATGDCTLAEVADADPVRVTPDTDVVDVALLMADYNLMTVPVVDDDNRLIGVITVDDILEATIPDDWRRREPPPHPDSPEGGDARAAGSTSAS